MFKELTIFVCFAAKVVFFCYTYNTVFKAKILMGVTIHLMFFVAKDFGKFCTCATFRVPLLPFCYIGELLAT